MEGEQLFVDWRPTDSLSVTLVQGFLFWTCILLGGATTITHGAQLTGVSFWTYAIVCWVWIGISFTISIYTFGTDIRDAGREDAEVLVGVLGVGILGATISLFTQRPNPDDFYYVPNAVYYLQNPSSLMGFEVHFFESGGEKIKSLFWGTSVPYDYFRAAAAWGTGSGYLPIYYLWSAAAVAFLIPLSIFYLLTRFVGDTKASVFGTAFAVAILLLMGDTHRAPGNFAFTRAFQGKTLLLSAGVPLFSALTIDFYRDRTWFNWVFLFAACTGLLGATISSAVLLPALGSVLTIGLLCAGMHWSRIGGWALQYGTALTYIFAYAGIALVASYHEMGPGSPVNQGWPTTFWGHLAFFIPHESVASVDIGGTGGPKSLMGYLSYVSHLNVPVTLILIAFVTGMGLWVLSDRVRWFLGGWVGALFVLYLNPLVAELHIQHTTSPNIYWRLFYLHPTFLFAGVIGVYFQKKMIRNWKYACSFLVLLIIPHFAEFSWSSISKYVSSTPQLDLPAQALQISKVASKKAPAGSMLSPYPMSGIIPMIDSEHPQVCVRRDGVRLWTKSPDHAENRIGACQFVGGEGEEVSDLESVIEEGVASSFLIAKDVFEGEVLKRMRGRGFRTVQKIEGSNFLLVSRGGSDEP